MPEIYVAVSFIDPPLFRFDDVIKAMENAANVESVTAPRDTAD